MKLINVKKPSCELEKSDSPTLHRGQWAITGFYGTDGNYYERFTSTDTGKEKWQMLRQESAQ